MDDDGRGRGRCTASGEAYGATAGGSKALREGGGSPEDNSGVNWERIAAKGLFLGSRGRGCGGRRRRGRALCYSRSGGLGES